MAPAARAAEVVGIFPTPYMRVPGLLEEPLVRALVDHFATTTSVANNTSPKLSHSAVLRPEESPLFVRVAERVGTVLPDFGELLFGERLGWSVKEMWVNVLETGGHQAMHNHANSFVSGVVYLTESDAASRTVFMKSPGGTGFAFRNDHDGVSTNAYCAERWIGPPAAPGDVALFPSYLLHAVPPNAGARRITLAFNAIPTRLDSWGYAIGFTG